MSFYITRLFSTERQAGYVHCKDAQSILTASFHITCVPANIGKCTCYKPALSTQLRQVYSQSGINVWV